MKWFSGRLEQPDNKKKKKRLNFKFVNETKRKMCCKAEFL